MTDRLLYIYNKICSNSIEVHNSCIEFYGEDNVDLQGLSFEDFLYSANNEYIRNIINYSSFLSYNTNFDLNSENDYCTSFLTLYHFICNLEEDLIDDFIDNFCNSTFNFLGFIYIYFSNIRITNELDEYRDITKLYVKIPLNYNGTTSGQFQVIRSEYTQAEAYYRYTHSHVPRLPDSRIPIFGETCLGEGPIRNTISSLSLEYNLDLWNLYFHELNTYIRIESLDGGPYIRMSSVNLPVNSITRSKIHINYCYKYATIYDSFSYSTFIPYLIHKNRLKFNYNDGIIGIAMSFRDFHLIASEEFINYINDLYRKSEVPSAIVQNCLDIGFLYKTIKEQNNFISIKRVTNNVSYSHIQNTYLFTFKNNDVKLNIIESEVSSEDIPNTIHILNPNITSTILKSILKVINYEYHNKSANTAQQSSSFPNKRKYYL